MSPDIPRPSAPFPVDPEGAAGAPQPPRDAVQAVVWPWRQDTPEERARAAAREVRAARRGAALRTVVGLVIAVALAFWKPWLAIVVVTISLITLALALASPRGAYARLEHGLQRFAHGVGMTVTWIVMPVLYYLLFLPVGWFLRARGSLRLSPRPDRGLASYWSPPHHPEDAGRGGRWQGAGLDRYRRQF